MGGSWAVLEVRGQTLVLVVNEVECENLSTIGEQGECNSIHGPLIADILDSRPINVVAKGWAGP